MDPDYLPPSQRVLFSWVAPEHIHVRPNPRAIMVATALLFATIAYALYTDSALMAITFILIGVVGYLFLTKDPQEVEFIITREGIVVGRNLYAFEDIHSFWIFDEAPLENVLSIHSYGVLAPYIHLPLGDLDHDTIRELMLQYIPEEKQEPRLVDIVEKMLHI